MEIISQAYAPIPRILKRFWKRQGEGRLMKYCIQQPTEDGVLLFNLLTRELVLLTWEEYANPAAVDALWERWFVVPVDTNEKELVDFARLVLGLQEKKKKPVTNYTIYTTTDCNARCYYCFQKGIARIVMSHETARQTVEYIKSHCGGKKVKLHWFGGEPLLNTAVIDLICDGLDQAGVEFESYLVSNGYLLTDELVRRAVECWKIRCVQITLDGTEKIYNRSKAYIYPEGNPYQVVLANLERLQKASVPFMVRLNVDLHNAENLMNLVDELGARYSGKKGVTIYASHLFREGQSLAELHTPEGWAKREEAMIRLENCIARWGMAVRRGIQKALLTYNCRADSGSMVTITPGGDIGTCDRYSDRDFIGHVSRQEFDPEMWKAWQEKLPPFPECPDCVHYPDCLRLKKCPGHQCFPQKRDMLLRDKQRRMVSEYQCWKNQEDIEEQMELDD